MLLEKGYSVSPLSRKANLFGKVRVYRWNSSEKILNPEIIEGVDYIVHLAGANLCEKRRNFSGYRQRETILPVNSYQRSLSDLS
jgi:hypothetical protein